MSCMTGYDAAARILWELEETRVRLDLVDAAIRTHQAAGEQGVVERLLKFRRVAARHLVQTTAG